MYCIAHNGFAHNAVFDTMPFQALRKQIRKVTASRATAFVYEALGMHRSLSP